MGARRSIYIVSLLMGCSGVGTDKGLVSGLDTATSGSETGAVGDSDGSSPPRGSSSPSMMGSYVLIA